MNGTVPRPVITSYLNGNLLSDGDFLSQDTRDRLQYVHN